MRHTQKNRLIAVYTPFDEDVLLLAGFGGTEGLSMLFDFKLDMLSEIKNIEFEKILGQGVTVSIKLADGKKRFFDGIASRCARGMGAGENGGDGIFSHYSAVMVPKLWLLTNTTDSRIFQDRTVPEILEKVLGEHEITFRNDLGSDYPKREYCVQYRESDFNFISRLMEEEGIYYFFEHEYKKHTMVLTDSPETHKSCAGQGSARLQTSAGVSEKEDRILGFYNACEVRPAKWALNDYNFKTPNNDLNVNAPCKLEVCPGDREIYECPGSYSWLDDGRRLANVCMEGEEARITTYTGGSVCRAFTSGFRFELLDHYRKELNGIEYVLTSLGHGAVQADYGADGRKGGTSKSTYRNQFTCIPVHSQYRPPKTTHKPLIHGGQTAIVVGPKGEEIYTDRYGRVKVQFHWDREGQRDEKSSCWIRVGQSSAGPGWGSVFIPRIGQEVAIIFIDGDPDRPFIVSCAYHQVNPLPFDLPGEKTKSGIRTNSTIGGGGANELSFEDKKGSEEIYIHAEKDWNIIVKNNKGQLVGNDETHKVEGEMVIAVKKKVTLVCGESTIVLEPDKITISSPSIHLNPDKRAAGATAARLARAWGGSPALLPEGSMSSRESRPRRREKRREGGLNRGKRIFGASADLRKSGIYRRTPTGHSRVLLAGIQPGARYWIPAKARVDHEKQYGYHLSNETVEDNYQGKGARPGNAHMFKGSAWILPSKRSGISSVP